MKRFYLSLIAIAAIAALTAAGSFALFTASTTNANNTFTAGTVTLDAAANQLLDVTNMAPGDVDDETYVVTYSGNLDAWVGASVVVGGDLLTCDATPLDVNVVANVGTAAVPVPSAMKAIAKVAAHDVDADITPIAIYKASNGPTFNIHAALPITAGNGCQGKSATISLKVYAVQAAHNTLNPGFGPISWK